MFGKNKNKKVGLCVMVVTASLVLAGIWAVLATPETALAKKPTDPGGGGGGKGGAAPNCVIFDDVEGDSVQSDWDDTGAKPAGDNPYFHNKKENITVKFSHDGHLTLNTNSTDKAGAGRGLFIDFGTPVTLSNGETIQRTDDPLAESWLLGVSAKLKVGAHQEHEFDFLNMLPGEFDTNVNLRILVWFYFKDGSRDHLFIRLDPDGTYRTCPSSDPVTVTYLGTPDPDGLRKWRVDYQTLVDGEGACISRSSDCYEGEGCLLLDVNDATDENPCGLDPGHIAMSFGFTVTAAP